MANTEQQLALIPGGISPTGLFAPDDLTSDHAAVFTCARSRSW